MQGAETAPLLCPSCAGAQVQHAGPDLVCDACGWRSTTRQGVHDFAAGDASDTQLDVDAYMGQLPSANAYKSLFDDLDQVVRDVLGDRPIAETLELGAGNGAWTWGLSRSPRYRSLYATDVSPEFLYRISDDVLRPGTTLVRCPAERLRCAPGSLDLVVGRSVLHHIHDYAAVLSDLRTWLRPDGAAVFFEPVLQGKLWIAFFMEMMRRLDQPGPNTRIYRALNRLRRRNAADQILSNAAHTRLQGTMRHILKDYYHPNIDAIRPTIEDKYVFDIEELLNTAHRAGFSQAEIVNQRQEGGLALTRIRNAIRGALGDEKDKLDQFEALFDAFEATFGLSAETAPIAPMVYFVFRP